MAGGGLMYLLDTNILLELLLDQEKADQVERFLRRLSPNHLYLSECALYSLGIILFRRRHHNVFLRAVQDLLVTGGMGLARLEIEDMQDIVQAAQKFRLDFDDAYQYVAAEKYDLIIVSFDGDFDRTERGRKTPADILQASF
jgi:predicted nucleic acid-binding protein